MNDTSQPAEVVPATDGADSAVAPPQRSLPQASLWWWCFLIGAATAAYIAVGMRYLETLSGHNTATQLLGLMSALGGMAVGAILGVVWARRFTALFLCYALIVIVPALAGTYFHEIFSVVLHIADGVSLRGGLFTAAALLFFLSALLGMSGVCVVIGVLRLRESPAADVYMSALAFYMTGAAAAVLAVNLSLIYALGLAVAIAVAGVLHAVIALAVWIAGHRLTVPGDAPEREVAAARPPLLPLVVIAAMFAAAAVYLVGWARLWSFFLGDTPLAATLLPAAFMSGLAAGGFWRCYKWAGDKSGEGGGGLLALLLMGAMMTLSPFIYPELTRITADLYATGARNDGHWERVVVINALNLAIVIFPVGVCAALAVGAVFHKVSGGGAAARGEAAVGWLYAAAFIGVAVGAGFGAFLLLPSVGIAPTLLIAGSVVMFIGVILYGIADRQRLFKVFSFTVVWIAIAQFIGAIPPELTSLSAIAGERRAEAVQVFAATGGDYNVGVDEWEDGNLPLRSLIVNGRYEADMYTRPLSELPNFTADEMAMVLTGLYPLLYKPDAARVMNIGLHNPLAARALLLSPHIRQVDNIGVEEKTLDALQEMGARVAPIINDPRNAFQFGDARTMLAYSDQTYDVIIANTDDLWRRAAQGQLSREFYRHAHDALVEDGIFVQRFAMWEVSADLLGAAAQAMAEVFPAYKVYVAADRYIIFVATPAARLPAPADDIFAVPDAHDFLAAYRFFSVADAEAELIGGKEQIAPYFASFSTPVNSDYQPFIEGKATFNRFQRVSYYSLSALRLYLVPVMEPGGEPGVSAIDADLADAPYSRRRAGILRAAEIYRNRNDENGVVRRALQTMATRPCPTSEGVDDIRLLEDISTLMSALMPHIDARRAQDIWDILATDPCIAGLLAGDDNTAALYTRFWRALSLRNIHEVALLGAALRFTGNPSSPSGQVIMLATIWANHRLGNYPQVIALLNELPLVNHQLHHLGQFIGAQAAAEIK